MARVKNKLIISLLAVASAFSLTACDFNFCTHTYDNACDTTCNICNEERAITHTPNADDNDCTTAITCNICGTTTTEAQEHDFTGEWQKTEDGHYHICANDGCTVEDTKVEHNGGKATCTYGKLCEDCGYEYEGKNPDNHVSDVYTYEINDNETHKKIHECGVVVDEGKNTPLMKLRASVLAVS